MSPAKVPVNNDQGDIDHLRLLIGKPLTTKVCALPDHIVPDTLLIETPFGKTDKIHGGAGTFIGLAASNFNVDSAVVSVVGGDFPFNVQQQSCGRSWRL